MFIHGLELLPDGRFRFRTILIMVARQNGKTLLLEFKNLWKMYVLEVPLIIGTSVDLPAAEETWEHAIEMIEGVPELDVEVKHVDKTNGKKTLRLLNGSRWLVRALGRRAARSFSADDVNLDELREHLDWLAWAAVTKTQMARPKGQAWCTSNAGDDRSVVLNSLQRKARNADPKGTLGLFEWSAPPSTRCTCRRLDDDPHTEDCQLQDRKLWAMANPGLGFTILEETLASALETDPTEVFLTECLCVRVVDLGGGVINEIIWASRADESSTAAGWAGIGVDASPDLRSAAIGMAGTRPDGKRHWQLLRHDLGASWVVPHLGSIREDVRFGPVGVDPASPAGALIPDIKAAGFEVEEITGRGLVAAWGAFKKDVDEGDGFHCDQDGLNAAVRDARNAPSGDVERFSRKRSSGDICPLVAVTIADGVLRTVPEPVTQQFMVAFR